MPSRGGDDDRKGLKKRKHGSLNKRNKSNNNGSRSGDGGKKSKNAVEHAAGQEEEHEDLKAQTTVAGHKSNGKSKGKTGAKPATATEMRIEALDRFRELLATWPKDMSRLFDPALPEERRGELWEVMCEGGDALRQRFAWAIPDERALRILKHFGPVVEIGSGLGYWAMLLRVRGVDVNAYDKLSGNPPAPEDEKTKDSRNNMKSGAKNGPVKSDVASGRTEKRPTEVQADEEDGEEDEPVFWTKVEEGGPEVLEEEKNEKRSLFLCYPDDFEGEDESLGLRCLHSFEGEMVIHVGELFGDSVSMTPGQAPWGRTTSRECQEELASKFHCILKVPIPRWPHSRDNLTVWKRHAFSAIHYDAEDDDDESESEQEKDQEQDQNQPRDSGDDSDRNASSPPSPHAAGSSSPRRNEENRSVGGIGGNHRKTEKDEAKGRTSDKKKRSRLLVGLEEEGKQGVQQGRGSEHGSKNRGSGDGSSDDHEEDGSSSDKGSSEGDDMMMMDGFPISALMGGISDLDMYAFVPEEEAMSCVQAAPCVHFLLDSAEGRKNKK